MSRTTAMKTMTATAAAAEQVTATATATTMTKISQSYRAWQVPALGSKGEAISLFLFKHMVTKTLAKSMLRATGAATTTATATMVMVMTKISQSYRAWQVPALGIKGAAIRLFLYKHSDHVVSDGNGDQDDDRDSSRKKESNSNREKEDNDTSVL